MANRVGPRLADVGRSERLVVPVFGIVGGVLCIALIGTLNPTVAILALAGLLFVCVAPRHMLLSAALASYVLLPFVAIPERPVLVNPGYALLFAWLVRASVGRDQSEGGRAGRVPGIAPAVALWLAFLAWSSLVSLRYSEIASFAWVIAFAAPMIPLLRPRQAASDARRLVPFFGVLSVVVAVYAIVEFGLARNPIFDPIYAANGLSYVGRWSVYRSHATFGHPLYASTFFSVAFVFLFGRWLATNRVVTLVSAAIVGLALATTVSRSAVLAAGIGAIAALFVMRRQVGQVRRVGIILIGGLVGLVLLQTALGARATSVEAESSAGVRTGIIAVAWDASGATHHLGWGAALSQSVVQPFNPMDYVLENSYFQLLVSIGLPGLAFFAVGSLAVLALFVRSAAGAAAGAWSAFLISVGGYNAFEALPTLSLLAAIIIAVGTISLASDSQGSEPRPETDPDPTIHPRPSWATTRSSSTHLSHRS